MPSLIKTAFLQLNKWAGNEYPKREDFVSDNEKIDVFASNVSSQMAQINIERGYLKSKILTSENDLNNIVLNGKYWVNGSANTPVYGGYPRTQGYLDITSINGSANDDNYVVQKYVINSIEPLHFERTRVNGTWSDWFLISKAIAPTETVITSGFASGWSGEIRLGKTQEGIKYIHIVSLSKTSDISTGGEVPYTIPIGHRPIKTVSQNLVGYSSGGSFKAGSSIQVRVQADGVLALTSTGSVTADVRSIVGAVLTFI